MNFETINDWFQFGAALTTIVVTPWALNSFRLFVRSKIKATCWRTSSTVLGAGWGWNVDLRHRTAKAGKLEIIVCPSTPHATIQDCFFLEPRDRHFEFRHEIKNGKLRIYFDFWPAARNIHLLIKLSAPDYIDFFVDGKSQPASYDLGSSSSEFSGNRSISLVVARMRFILVTMQFGMMTAAALLRIAYLGIFGRSI